MWSVNWSTWHIWRIIITKSMCPSLPKLPSNSSTERYTWYLVYSLLVDIGLDSLKNCSKSIVYASCIQVMVAACEPCMSMHLSVWPQLIEGSNVCILWAPSCLMWNCVPYTDEIANFIIYPDNCAHTKNLHTSQPSSSQGQYDPEVYREDLSTNLWLFASFHHFCPNLA